MRLFLPREPKLPIDEDQVLPKTKENWKNICSLPFFLQTQEAVLERILGIREEISELESTIKADVIRNITKDQEEQSKKRLKKLRRELKGLSKLKFNHRELFSQNGSDTSFKLFQPVPVSLRSSNLQVKSYIDPIKVTTDGRIPKLRKSLRHFRRCWVSQTLQKVICKQVLLLLPPSPMREKN